MPGQITINKTKSVRAVLVQYLPSVEDEQAIMEGKGQWPEGYVPTTKIMAHYRSEGGEISPPILSATGAPAAEAIREFFITLPAGHALIRGILDGTIQDSEDIQGGSENRRVLDGTVMDFHDGSGEFTVTADE